MLSNRVSSDDKRGLAELAQMCRSFGKDMPIDLASADVAHVASRLKLRQPILYASHRPEPTAERRVCFYNAIQKQERNGGRTQWGWTFHGVMTMIGPYAWANHHGIWISPEGEAVDVTPFPVQSKDQPTLDAGGRVVFAPDDSADPWIAPDVLGTLPQRRVALGANPRAQLVAWLKRGDEEDRRRVDAEIEAALRR